MRVAFVHLPPVLADAHVVGMIADLSGRLLAAEVQVTVAAAAFVAIAAECDTAVVIPQAGKDIAIENTVVAFALAAGNTVAENSVTVEVVAAAKDTAAVADSNNIATFVHRYLAPDYSACDHIARSLV